MKAQHLKISKTPTELYFNASGKCRKCEFTAGDDYIKKIHYYTKHEQSIKQANIKGNKKNIF